MSVHQFRRAVVAPSSGMKHFVLIFFFYSFVVKQQSQLPYIDKYTFLAVATVQHLQFIVLMREGSEVFLLSLVFDKVIYDHLKVKYSPVGHAFDWA